MRKLNFFSLLAATALLAGVTACNNDDVMTPESGEKAKLSVSVTAPADNTRANTPGSFPADAVNNFSVFITENGAVKYSAYSADGTNLTGVKAIDVTTRAEHVYVVANAGDLTSSITTLASLKNYMADLVANGTGTQIASRWATGTTTSALVFSKVGGDYRATAAVNLTFIAARLTIKVDNSMTNYSAPGALKLKSIAVLNARGQSLLFPANDGTLIPATYAAGKNYYQGLANNSFDYYPATTSFTMATDLLTDALPDPATNLANTYYYYVFESKATKVTDFPTIVTIVGEKQNGDKVYWPVHLAPYEQWANGTMSTITRGKSYNIQVKLKGDATSGEGGGTTDPTDPIIPGANDANVEVNVTLSDWVPVLLEKEF